MTQALRSATAAAPKASPAPATSTVTQLRRSTRIGDTDLPVRIVRNGPGNVFLNVHLDEKTSRGVAEAHVRAHGGSYLEFDTGSTQRHLKVRVGKTTYSVDPNRMFSVEGLLKSERHISPKPTRAVAQRIVKDAVRFLEDVVKPELARTKATALVAMHNNTHDHENVAKGTGQISVSFYEGRPEQADQVFRAPTGDHDDLILTPNQDVFDGLKGEGTLHAVRLRPGLAKTSLAAGMLSEWWQGPNALVAGRPTRYVNSEAEHGHAEVQHQQLAAVDRVTKRASDAAPTRRPR